VTIDDALNLDETVEPLAPPGLPEGRPVELPGRGTTFVRECAGPPGAPTLVLLHGWTASSAVNWFPAYEPLSERFRVVALDHRGHGRGIRSNERFRLADCSDDVAALAEVLEIDRVIAVGYSMGGPIAQLLWHRHRELVAGLVLCATSRNFVGGGASDRAWLGVATGLSYAARAAPPNVRRRVAERILVGRYDDTPLGMWVRSELRRNDIRALAEAGRALGAYTSREWIGDVDVPTAVVLTEHDLVVPPVRQRKLAAAIPDARVHTVPGGHDVCATAPQRFVPVLLDACIDVAARASSAQP
jgi:3-oxoadipate enol-lactonase